jgi:ribosomal protein S18 acetylase RimI-like enzyme
MNPAALQSELRTDGLPAWRSSARGLRRADLAVETRGCQSEPGTDEKVSAVERHVTRPQSTLAIVIRPATPKDAEAVARVQIESWRGAYKHLFSDEQLAAISLAERTANWSRWPPLVAEVDGDVVGFVAVGPAHDADADGELWAIYVRPDRWGMGIGRALIEAGEARLRELGHTSAVLWVFEDNPRARRFYEAAGWALDGAGRQAELFGMSAPAVRYTKSL